MWFLLFVGVWVVVVCFMRLIRWVVIELIGEGLFFDFLFFILLMRRFWEEVFDINFWKVFVWMNEDLCEVVSFLRFFLNWRILLRLLDVCFCLEWSSFWSFLIFFCYLSCLILFWLEVNLVLLKLLFVWWMFVMLYLGFRSCDFGVWVVFEFLFFRY